MIIDHLLGKEDWQDYLLKEYKKKFKNVLIKIPNQKLKSLNYKYLSPFFGIVICMVLFF